MYGIRVRAEPIPGTAPDHNLVAAAWPGQVNPEWADPEDWRKGVQWKPWNCVEAGPWDPNCAAYPKENLPEPPDVEPTYEVDSWVIHTEYGCTLPGGASALTDEYQDIALEQNRLATPKALEFQFWVGTLTSRFQSLDTESTQVTGADPDASGQREATLIGDGVTPYDRQVGLALIGQGLANAGAGSKGMIHAPAWIVELWYGDGLLTIDSDGYLVTQVRGDRVVAGSGYPGTGLDGLAVTGTESWIYGTGPVEFYLDEPRIEDVEVASSLDRTTNEVIYHATRSALTRFDPCSHVSTLIDGATNGGG